MNAIGLDSPRATFPTRRNNPPQSAAPFQAPKPAVMEPPPAVDYYTADKTHAIVARVDVGWGNTLYIRGEGGCLSWDIGLPMICSGDDRWVWSCRAEQTPRQFKFLINDEIWATGDNLEMSGADITVCSPRFPV